MVNLPDSCCMNVGGAGPIKFCDKPATHWYQHNEDICSYCDEHDYQCGAPIHGGKGIEYHDGYCDLCGDRSTHLLLPTEGEVNGLCPKCHQEYGPPDKEES